MTENDTLKKSPEERIGTSSHSTRNLALAGGLLGAIGLITLFYWRTGKSDEVAIEELQTFRSAMATQCKQEQFAKPPQKELNSLYADSSRMQAVVREQFGSLQRGQPNCEQILKTLKSVDFPVE